MIQITKREVTNVASLLEATRSICCGFGKTVYWFRGHAQASWKLVPFVLRDYNKASEHYLMARFRLSAPTRYERCPELQDLARWICLMQHFGLPTRLLDWTASLMAAAFFAVTYDPKPGPAAIWVLVPSELNKMSPERKEVTFSIHGREAEPLLQIAFDGGEPVDTVLAVLGQDVDLRMTIQQGAFTLHGDSTPLEEKAGVDRALAKLIIPEKAKPTFDEELWVLGVRRSALFPDLSNLARDLANDWRIIPKKS